MNQADDKNGIANVDTDKTVGLMDAEVETIQEHQRRIGSVALKFEEILIEADMSMGDLAEILDLFNARAHSVFSRTKIKEVKQHYEQPQ
jgi:hypothetical protein